MAYCWACRFPTLGEAVLNSKVTIHEVARLSGVSIKTVSRVLNREPNVKSDTRSRVQEAVAALNYRPNISARSLAGSKAYLIGVFFDNPSPAYVTDCLLYTSPSPRD